MADDTRPPRIVIAGGGAGGLQLAVLLAGSVGRRREAEVVLVDRSLTHVWKPLLHEIAAGTLAPQDAPVDYLQQARRHGFTFHLGAIDRVDRGTREVWLEPLDDADGEPIAPARAVAYDQLVVALGSVVDDFGIPGVREHALALDDEAGAQRFHRRLLAACARAELQADGPVRVAIVGGGATGVELAAELAESTRELAAHGAHLSHLPRPVVVTVVEAGPRLLAALPPATARDVQDDLEASGVEVRVDTRVAQVERDGLRLADGRRCPAHLVVWAAGIRGPAVLARFDGLPLDRSGRLVVAEDLRTPSDARVRAFGDCAAVTVPEGVAPVPPRAQAASQQAHWLAGVIEDALRGEPSPGPFRFRDQGTLVALGRRHAVGRVRSGWRRRGLAFDGRLARWTYAAVQRRHRVTLNGWLRTALAVVGGWLGGRAMPRVKLH